MKYFKIVFLLISVTVLMGCFGEDAELPQAKIISKGVWSVDIVAEDDELRSNPELGEQEKINFGVVAWMEREKVNRAYRPFIEYLSEKVGRQFRLLIEYDESSLRNQFRIGNIPVGVVSAISYSNLFTTMGERLGLRYIANFIKINQYKYENEYYTGTIFCRKDNKEISVVSDLKDRIMGFVSPESLAGYIYPIFTLLHKEVEPFGKRTQRC